MPLAWSGGGCVVMRTKFKADRRKRGRGVRVAGSDEFGFLSGESLGGRLERLDVERAGAGVNARARGEPEMSSIEITVPVGTEVEPVTCPDCGYEMREIQPSLLLCARCYYWRPLAGAPPAILKQWQARAGAGGGRVDRDL